MIDQLTDTHSPQLEAILALIRGEAALEEISKQSGIAAEVLLRRKEQFLSGGAAALRSADAQEMTEFELAALRRQPVTGVLRAHPGCWHIVRGDDHEQSQR